MSDTVDLRVSDPAVWDHVCELQRASFADLPSLSVRCNRCGKVLAKAGITSAGPLFTSSWEEWEDDGHQIYIDGKKLAPRANQQLRNREAEHGSTYTGKGLFGYFAPLAIPADLPQEYVPLFVRCPNHGDAVLDHAEVMGHLRAGTPKMRVKVTGMTWNVIPQQIEGLKREPTKTLSRKSRAQGVAMPLEDLKEYLSRPRISA